MAATLKDIYKLLDSIDKHARAITAQHSELRSMLASLKLPQAAEFPCPVCDTPLAGERALAFHMQNVHDGFPVPLTEAEKTA